MIHTALYSSLLVRKVRVFSTPRRSFACVPYPVSQSSASPTCASTSAVCRVSSERRMRTAQVMQTLFRSARKAGKKGQKQKAASAERRASREIAPMSHCGVTRPKRAQARVLRSADGQLSGLLFMPTVLGRHSRGLRKQQSFPSEALSPSARTSI